MLKEAIHRRSRYCGANLLFSSLYLRQVPLKEALDCKMIHNIFKVVIIIGQYSRDIVYTSFTRFNIFKTILP